jgi:hypothetical protein
VEIAATEFVTIAEASRRLGVAPNTLRSWGALGKIQEYRHPMNNYRLYRLDDVTSLVAVLNSPVKVNKVTQSQIHKNSECGASNIAES